MTWKVHNLRGLFAELMIRSMAVLPVSFRAALSRNGIGVVLRRILSLTAGRGPRPLVIKDGPCKGLVLVADLHAYRAHFLGIYEPEICSAIVDLLRPGMTAFDVGAHIGYMSLLMARLVTPAGTVHAFEPCAENRVLLEQTMALNSFNHVRIIDAAVSRATGEAALRPGADPSRTRLVPSGSPRATTNVRTVTLDDFAEENKIARIDLIKMDIEGSEIDALNGARKLLRVLRPVVICEFHSDALFNEGSAIFNELGYACAARTLYNVPHVIARPA